MKSDTSEGGLEALIVADMTGTRRGQSDASTLREPSDPLASLRNWKIGAGHHGWALWCAAAILLVHSAVDFPLRTSALATLLAITFAAQENRSSALPPRGALA